MASTIQYDTLLSSQETDTLTAYYEPFMIRLCDRLYFVFISFPRGFPCAVPNSIRFSGGSFPPPGPPSSFGTVCRPPDQRPVVATRRTLGNRAGRVKSRCQDSDALSADPWIDRFRRPPRQPSRRPRFTSDSLSRRRSCILGAHRNAGWSSSVARWAHNPEVAGSNPVPAT